MAIATDIKTYNVINVLTGKEVLNGKSKGFISDILLFEDKLIISSNYFKSLALKGYIRFGKEHWGYYSSLKISRL